MAVCSSASSLLLGFLLVSNVLGCDVLELGALCIISPLSIVPNTIHILAFRTLVMQVMLAKYLCCKELSSHVLLSTSNSQEGTSIQNQAGMEFQYGSHVSSEEVLHGTRALSIHLVNDVDRGSKAWQPHAATMR